MKKLAGPDETKIDYYKEYLKLSEALINKEEEIAALKKDNNDYRNKINASSCMTKLIKRILVDIQEATEFDIFCTTCKKYGQNIQKCDCMQDDECAYNIIKLATDYYRR